MQNCINIKLPQKYQLTDVLFAEFQLLNLDLSLEKVENNTLCVGERAYKFEDYGWVELKFPASIFTNSNFDELYKSNLNNERINFEQLGNHSILLKMGTFMLISAITASILISLGSWVIRKNRGRTYSENGEYQLKDENSENSETGIYMADISYISYETASEETQKKWKKRIQIAPTLCIEVVSSKYGLKRDLWKMQNVWMRFETELGIVVCPFSKKIFIFEKGKSSYREQSIYEPFTHELLSEYEGDFSKYVDEI